MDVKVCLAPAVRMTRASANKTQPKYKDMVKMLGVKIDKMGNTLIKVLCQGSPRHVVFWVNRTSLIGKDVDKMVGKGDELPITQPSTGGSGSARIRGHIKSSI